MNYKIQKPVDCKFDINELSTIRRALRFTRSEPSGIALVKSLYDDGNDRSMPTDDAIKDDLMRIEGLILAFERMTSDEK